MEAAEVTARPRKTTRRRKRPPLAEGTRVRLRAPSPGLTLASELGTVIGPDERDGDLGYYVVRLDAPASYDHGGSAPETLEEVVELADNLDVLAAPQAAPSTSSALTQAGAEAPQVAGTVASRRSRHGGDDPARAEGCLMRRSASARSPM